MPNTTLILSLPLSIEVYSPKVFPITSNYQTQIPIVTYFVIIPIIWGLIIIRKDLFHVLFALIVISTFGRIILEMTRKMVILFYQSLGCP